MSIYKSLNKAGFASKLGFVVAVAVAGPNIACAQQQVTIEVEGNVQPHCAFEEALSPNNNGRDLVFDIRPDDPSWSQQNGKLPLSLSCNAPFTVAVRANNGALKNIDTELKAIGGAFSSAIDYQVALSVSTEEAAAPVSLTCQSQDLKGPSSACGAASGTYAAIGSGAGVGEIAVKLSGSSGFPIKGRYQDTIIVALALQ